MDTCAQNEGYAEGKSESLEYSFRGALAQPFQGLVMLIRSASLIMTLRNLLVLIYQVGLRFNIVTTSCGHAAEASDRRNRKERPPQSNELKI